MPALPQVNLFYMNIHIFTFSFDPATQKFPCEAWEAFVSRHQVLEVQAHFFTQAGQAYWTVWVSFLKKNEPLEEPDPLVQKRKDWLSSLPRADKDHLSRLYEYRRKKAKELGYPPYLVLTNKQVEEIIQKQVRSKKALLTIKGFGKKRAERYGEEILKILNT